MTASIGVIVTVIVAGIVAWLRWGRYGIDRYLRPPDVQACVWDWVTMMSILFALWAWMSLSLRDALAYGWALADVFVGVLAWLIPSMALAATALYLLIGLDLRRELLAAEDDQEELEELYEKFIRLRGGMNEEGSTGADADPGVRAAAETGPSAG